MQICEAKKKKKNGSNTRKKNQQYPGIPRNYDSISAASISNNVTTTTNNATDVNDGDDDFALITLKIHTISMYREI